MGNIIILSLIVVLLVIVVLSVVVFAYDVYKYPICSRCGHNLYAKRIKGKIICGVHGEC